MSKSEFDLKWTFDAETGEEQGPGDALGQNFKHRPYASLLREAVQNSLDVPANPNTPVIVTFSFGKMREKDFPNFFDIRESIWKDVLNIGTVSQTLLNYTMKCFLALVQISTLNFHT